MNAGTKDDRGSSASLTVTMSSESESESESESLYKLFIVSDSSFMTNGIPTLLFQWVGERIFYQEGVIKFANSSMGPQCSINVLTFKQLVATSTLQLSQHSMFFAEVALCEDSVVVMKSPESFILSNKYTGDRLVRYTNALNIGKIRPIDELFVDLNEQTLLDCIRVNYHLFKYFPVSRLTAELCCAAVAEYPQHLARVPTEIKTENYPMCLGAVTRYGSLLKWVPESIHTPELYIAALISDKSALEFIPTECRTYELYLAMMKADCITTANINNRSRFVPQCYQTREMCWAMVRAIVRETRAIDPDYNDGMEYLMDELNELLERLEKEEKKEEEKGQCAS